MVLRNSQQRKGGFVFTIGPAIMMKFVSLLTKNTIFQQLLL